MTDERRERFKELCKIAEIESDPDLLTALAAEINLILLTEAEGRAKPKNMPV